MHPSTCTPHLHHQHPGQCLGYYYYDLPALPRWSSWFHTPSFNPFFEFQKWTNYITSLLKTFHGLLKSKCLTLAHRTLHDLGSRYLSSHISYLPSRLSVLHTWPFPRGLSASSSLPGALAGPGRCSFWSFKACLKCHLLKVLPTFQGKVDPVTLLSHPPVLFL